MFELIYGIAGSGKSRYIENIFKEKLKTESKLMIIVPDQHSFITERSILEKFGEHDGSKIKVMWFNNLAKEVFKKYGGDKGEKLGNSGKAVIMSKALCECKDELNIYKRQVDKPEFIHSMLSLVEEIKYSKLETEELLKAGENSKRSSLFAKLKEVCLITDKFNQLTAESYLNPDDEFILVNDLLLKNNYFEGYTVAIDAFGYFDKQKLDIIARIIEQSKDTYITLCTDSVEYKIDDNSKFASIRKTASRLINIASEAGIEYKLKKLEIGSEMKGDFKAIAEGLFEPSPKKYEGDEKNIEIIKCEGIESECNVTTGKIKKLLIDGQYRYRDIAIILRNDEMYLPYLKQSFLLHSLPFYYDARRGISNEPLTLFCHYALKTISDSFRLDDIMACMKSKVMGFDTEEISEFENYCIMWNISGKRKWSREFKYNPEGFGGTISAENDEKIKRFNKIRKAVLCPLLKFSESAKNASVKEISIALYNLLEEVGAEKNLVKLKNNLEQCRELGIADEQARVWELFMGCLNQIVATRGEEVLSLKNYLSLLDIAVSSEKMGEIPQYLDEITVGNADRIRTDEPKVAFILGANDGEFPKSFVDSGILRDNEKIYLTHEGIELGMNCLSMNCDERFYAYCAVTAPSEKLFVTYKTSNYAGETLVGSSLVNGILAILPECESTIGESEIVSKKQGFSVLTSIWNKNTPLRQTLYDIYKNDSEYEGRIKAIERGLDDKPKAIEDENTAIALFGENMYISPSRMEAFYKCPFMYFCKFGLGAKALVKADLDNRTGGSFIHYILENFIRENPKDKMINLTDTQIKPLIEKYSKQYYEEMELPEEFLSNKIKFISGNNERIAFETIKRTIDEMKQSEYVPSDFELGVGKFSEVGNYCVALEKGEVSIKGVIDRVDTMKKDGKTYLRVIDYKTGGKDFELGEVLHGINAQMLLYLLALDEKDSKKYENIVPAGVLYVQAKNYIKSEKDRVDGDEQYEKASKNRLKELKMRGMVLDDEQSILGMEKDLSGKFIPVMLEKDELKGNIISLHQMALLRKKLDKLIENMGNSLHHGKIDDMPIVFGDSKQCDWCDYSLVCRNNGKEKVAPKVSFEQALEELESGDENE